MCSSDLHWAQGTMGYFPTYILGSMIAAQIYAAVKRELPNLEASLSQGDCKPLLSWLREKIHCHGERYPTGELIQRATGKLPSPDDYLTYLKEKFTALYSL